MLMTYMCDVYRGAIDPQNHAYIKNLIDNTRIHIMPSMNPDGWNEAAVSIPLLSCQHSQIVVFCERLIV